ncbi:MULTISPECIES: DNA-directed RNA polymerase subunit A' [unclassified Halorubrum]|uniref:DNA-directed RNA polymerase subunit A' n=1 Tax=unclassified Halorubrum TaxID=2642239 RepID=UPI000B99489A|nr:MULTISPECIES: DNA-directed RNA polymerase subunit A' [unclassified Halorubrum]OYR44536.1 DNA-directed RNA polymerase subunit A' [Halorubrum sp. Hd13]OYR48555.1 DNA-directed RNA polymerase subunit A' [Halorubrum sp. Eb13]OYR48799.1 DNA-directed RNA polymerase subunit A' [Halorubrum sp. Ea8]OYR56201.1 DNA-directed RNA polymerase subunit A' [Halorubrum sp. Ea1]
MQTPKVLGGIDFGLMDPETYRDMSATKVITADTYDDDGYPIDMGLMDPRLGVIDPGLECRTCGSHSGSCNGHFGHIELAAPVIHVGFTKLIRRLLRSTCRECGRLALDEAQRDEFRDRYERAKELGDDEHDVLKAAVRQARKASTCPFCGEPQADIKHEKPTTYYEVQDVLSGDYSERIAAAMQPDEEEDDPGTSPQELAEKTDIALDRINDIMAGEFRPRKEDRRSIEKALDVDLTEEDMNKLMPSDIRDWFEDIPNEDLEVLGIDAEDSRPEWMILTVLPVPPVTTRPSITLDNGQRSEDDLTHKLVDIIRINQRFMENREAGAPQLIIEDLWELLQYHVTTFVDNEISGTPPARHRSGRPLKTLSQRLKGKEGRFRGSLSGKRVNFSARTVISPDPTLSLNEVGVPDRVAKEMTQTLNVTERNVEEARQYVRNGPEAHPGANYVRRPDGRRLKVTEKNCEELAEKVEADWEVNRHLVDGDIVIFNRQPSLHRMSIMAHEVVVMPYKTFRLNTVVCPPYNADFDGDEMNMHALQNEEARAEARVLMRVQEQILSPRFGGNIIGAIQDHISGTYLLTHSNPEFTETQALDLLRATRVDELPEADGVDDDGRDYWTGRTLFSELLPDDLTLHFSSSTGDDVVIENGQLVEGTIDEDAVGAFGGEVVDTLTKEYGETRSRVFINEIASLAMRAIMHFGFSIGIDDESIPPEAEEQVDDAIESAYDRVQELIATYEAGELESLPGRGVDETLEMKIMQTLGKARDSAGEIADQHFGDDNPAVVMARSGARGSMLNLTQMAGSVGQQAVRGERINRGYEDRTLSHYKENDLSAEAHGFVENSYRGGLTPEEFFFHAMGGREGLVDTAVRTSKSGYLQRRLINALSELEAQYDGTVRDTSGRIVQFEFGEDGTSPVKVSSGEGDGIDVDDIVDRVVDSEFDSDDEKERFLGERTPPTNLSEHAGPGLNKASGVESDD